MKQVLDKVRRDGLVRTATVAFARLDRPVAPGYATAGTVMAVAPGVDDFEVGDRVACAGATYATHAEINYVPRNLVVPVPRRRTGEYVGFDEAAFTTVGAIALHGVRLGAPEIGHRVVVIGLGVIGLLATQILRAHGCRVFGIDLNPARCDLARALGADDAMAPMGAEAVVSRWSGGLGADLVVVAAATRGSDPAVLAAEVARDKGRIVAVGATGLDLPRRTLYQKELSLVVSRSYGPGRYDPDYEERGHDYPRAYVRWTERENMRTFLDLVADGRVDVRPLVSHRYDIERGADAYDTLEKGDALGILIDYGTAPAGGARPNAMPVSSRPRVHVPGRPRISVIGAGAFAQQRAAALVDTGGRDAWRSSSPRPDCPRDRPPTDSASRPARPRRTRSGATAAATPSSSPRGTTAMRSSPSTRSKLARRCSSRSRCASPRPTWSASSHVVDTLRAAGQAPFVMVGFNRRFAPSVEARPGGDGRSAREHRVPGQRRPSCAPELDRNMPRRAAAGSSARCVTSSISARTWPARRSRRCAPPVRQPARRCDGEPADGQWIDGDCRVSDRRRSRGGQGAHRGVRRRSLRNDRRLPSGASQRRGAGGSARRLARAPGQGTRRRNGRLRQRRGFGQRVARVIRVGRQHDPRHVCHRAVARVGRPGPRAVTDTSASPGRLRVACAGDGARRILDASPPGLRAPVVGPVVVLARSSPRSTRRVRRDPRQYFMRFRGKAHYAGPFDAGGIPLLDYRGHIGRQYNPIAIAHYGLARFNRWCGDRRQRRPHGMARRVALARHEPAVQRPRRAGVVPPLRLAVPAVAQGAVVFRAGAGQRPVDAGQGRGRDRRRHVRRCGASCLPVARAARVARRCARDRRARRRLDRGVHRRPAEPHSERVHLGALGRLRLRAMEPAGRVRRRCGRHVSATLEARLDDFDTGWWSCTRRRPPGSRCSRASTITDFTSCSFACSTS